MVRFGGRFLPELGAECKLSPLFFVHFLPILSNPPRQQGGRDLGRIGLNCREMYKFIQK